MGIFEAFFCLGLMYLFNLIVVDNHWKQNPLERTFLGLILAALIGFIIVT
tara:strand:+ start:2531 stop:2680 length:150 start_codon:yes stop_codon:yes gene_type:complete